MRNNIRRFCCLASWPLGVSAFLLLTQGCSPKACTGYHIENPATPSPLEQSEPEPTGPMSMDDAFARLAAADDWKQHPPLDLPRHPAEKYLAGWVIVLDPGHGGKSLEVPGWKTGPTGVREAEMNLRVGLMLRALLEDAGAIVGMTRTEEVSDIADDRIGDYDHGAPGSPPDADPHDPATWNTLKRRANFANTFPRPEHARPGGIRDAEGTFRGADLFISLHHNASSSPESNYTTVWFHGPPEDALVELDAARHLAREIGNALRTEVGKTSPVMNDRQMYPTGFAVLRQATVPAVLTESSFFTNPQEEQRLNDPGYLIREAYAIYRGLCELAYAGRPTQTIGEFDVRLVGESIGSGGAILAMQRMAFEIDIDDGQPNWWGHDLERTLSSTLTVTIDGQTQDSSNTQVDPETGDLRLSIAFMLPSEYTGRANWILMKRGTEQMAVADPELIGDDPAGGETIRSTHVVTIKHANFLKAHNWPQRYAVELKWEPDAALPEVVSVTPLGAKR